MPAAVHANRQGSLVHRLFVDEDTGRVAVVQMPNAPLWVFLVATALRLLLHPSGTVGTVLSVVSGAALVVWAVLEIARGDSLFRRLLGGVVLVALVLGRLLG
jgi:hypothetical protein